MKNSLMVLILGLIFCCSRVETPKNYLALGDSYTIGEGVAESDRWPVQLVEDLENRGYSIDSLQIIASTSWTTDELVLGVLETPTLPEYDLITIMIGVNNQYRGRSLENFKEELEILIKLSLKMTGGDPSKVFLISIPDWGVTPYADRFDGDLIADAAVKNNWSGVIINGCVRDIEILKTIDIGIQAIGAVPKKSEKLDKGSLREDIRIGDIRISNGNWVYADENGVLISEKKLDLS